MQSFTNKFENQTRMLDWLQVLLTAGKGLPDADANTLKQEVT